MQKLSLRAAGWAAVVSWQFLNIMMLIHQGILGTSSDVGMWQQQFLQALYPGYQVLDLTGVVIALVQGFIWPWVFALIFVTVYNKFIVKK